MSWILMLCSLSILILLHEFGHYITARWFNVRVEKFYLFFDAYFSLFKKKIGETVYGIGWLPLGGYVKLAGMIDESMDKEFLEKEPEEWEFRSKPAWQRLIIMLGGIIVNILLAWLIYTLLLTTVGRTYLPMENVTNGIAASELGEKYGFQDGDHLVSLNGKELKEYNNDILIDLLSRKKSNVVVNRDGQEVEIKLGKEFQTDLLKGKVVAPFNLSFPSEINEIDENSPLSKTKAQVGDQIVSFAGKEVSSHAALAEMLVQIDTVRTVDISFLRNGQIIQDQITPELIKKKKFLSSKEVIKGSRLGFVSERGKFFDYKTKNYNFFQAIPAGAKRTVTVLNGYIKQFKVLLTNKEGIKQIGGLGTFAKGFQGVNWVGFWEFTAFISIILAFMNLLPIPALDGGHALFCIYEIITGRKPNEKFLEIAQVVGFVLLMGLVLYANGMDVVRGLFG